VGSGYLVTVYWVRANGCNWDVHTCSAVARGGHLAVVQWAIINSCNCDAEDCLVKVLQEVLMMSDGDEGSLKKRRWLMAVTTWLAAL
jgi:hypothetical protein